MEKKSFYNSMKILNKKIEELHKIKKIVNLLDTKYKRSYIHLSETELKLDDIKNMNKNMNSWLSSNLYYNPKGLWISCSSSWLKFSLYASQPYYNSKWLDAKYIYKVDINPEKILRINKVNQLIDFHIKYLKKNNKFQIDWKKVKKDYDGIIICPYLGYKIWKDKDTLRKYFYENQQQYILNIIGNDIKKYHQIYLEWYRHWETGTGVIWRKSSIKNIEEIKLL